MRDGHVFCGVQVEEGITGHAPAIQRVAAAFGVWRLPFGDTATSSSIFFQHSTSSSLDFSSLLRTRQYCQHTSQHISLMGNTQAKLSAGLEQTKRNAKCNTLKRKASPTPLHQSIKRRAIVLDGDHTPDDLSDFPRDEKPCEALREILDEDEKFLELPQLFDRVGVVARKYGMDDGLLHRDYRGQDIISSIESRSGKWTISMSKVRDFRPVTAIASSVDVGTGKEHKQETFVLGREHEGDAQWLNVSFQLDTQIPHVVLRISAPSMKDSHGRYEPAYVYIFATNLARAPNLPLQIRTGKGVNISKQRAQCLADIRPRLLKKIDDGLLTETSLQLSRVDKGATDIEGRLSRPVVVSNISSAELDRMATEVADGKKDQPAHEQLLGLIHSNKIRHNLDLYSEYDGDNIGCEYAREANFRKLFRLVMFVCNELGNFWAYRLQFPEISWTDKNFPFEKLQPPRWTVRKWFARADKARDGHVVVAASPAQWQAISRPKALPGAEEESFMRGLDALEDDPTSMRAFVRKDFDSTTGD